MAPDEEDGTRVDGLRPAPLAPGSRIGRYEVKDLLGSGGMGRVYCAIDRTLDREVAIKALAGAFREDTASLKRFEREARLLASLSHPNIAAIYGFELFDGAPFLILERIDGETLAQRLKRGPLPLREAVGIAVQVADGLAEAHSKGVIHRDLKPSNVMLAAGGRVKLVDFGLAKTTGPGPAGDAVTQVTSTGMVVGTAPYMSPEQIHGETVDAGTDIWAFGCLLYEMLTGRGAFLGRSVPEVLAAALRDDPDWNALPSNVPLPVRRLLRRCLTKERRNRLQHVGDARLELLELSLESGPPFPGAASGSSEEHRQRITADTVQMRRAPRALPWTAASVGAAVAVGIALLVASSRRPAPPPPLRLSLELPRGLSLADEYDAPFAISPSGALLALNASEGGAARIYIRKLDDLSVTPLAGSEDPRGPFFSPDSRWVAFISDRRLKKAPVDGGPAVPLCEIGNNLRGGAWAPDGTIVLAASQTAGLSRVPDSGGRLAPLTKLDEAHGETSHRWPDVLPGGRWVLFTVALEGASYDEARLDVVSLETGERRTVLPNAGFGRYSPSGHLLFVKGGQLFAIPFDAKSLKTHGSAELVLPGIRYDPQNGGTHLSVSSSGALVYAVGVPASPDDYLSWLDREGHLQRISGSSRMFREPRLSPDGEEIAVAVGTSTESDLWLVDTNGGGLTQLTFGLSPHRPAWTPDGAHVTVGAERNGAWRLLLIAANGKGDPVVLFEGPHRMYPNAWSPDGLRLVFQVERPETGWDLFVLERDRAGRVVGAPRPLAATPHNEANADISPDGRWIAYESDELDALVQTHVMSFPEGVGKVRASSAGGRWVSWGSGGELTFWDTSIHQPVSAKTREEGGRLLVEPSRPVLVGGGAARPPVLARVLVTVTGGRIAVDRASGRFLVLEKSTTEAPPLSRPVIALGWAEGLRGKAR